MLILGSSLNHDTAAALFEDGIIKAAIEEDKLTRSRSAGLPENAIRFCLESTGATWRDIDQIAVATRPFSGWRRRSLLPMRLATVSPMAILHQANELGAFARKLSEIRRLRSNINGMGSKVVTFEHHLCHAASAFFFSPFDRALVVTMDEEGDGSSGMIAVGEGTRIRVLRTIPFPHSWAWLYSEITELLGFTPHHDEHKTQWLSLEGEPVFKSVFVDMFRNRHNHLPVLDRSYLNLTDRLSLSSKFYRAVGLQEGNGKPSDDLRRSLASSLQDACVEVVGSMIEHFRKSEGVDKVCLAGGLFQNALLVSSLERRLGIDAVFVPPAAGNPGCVLGAGALVWHHKMQKPRLPAVRFVYSGPSSNRSEVKDVLDNCKARYSLQTTVDRKLDATLELLQSGKIVGWFQGAAEFGPRALGNRSLLASPWASYVKENLNDYIKHREWFRPFAVAIPEEDCAHYFDCSPLCQSMSSLALVRPGSNVLPEGFILPGNLVRLHVVRQQSNPVLWRLLKRFGEEAPAPLLVNTSFNLFGEPLVVKPRDAVRSYFCSGMDALVIDNFVLSKTAAKILPASVALPKASSA
jgi:carbamoyltransferase